MEQTFESAATIKSLSAQPRRSILQWVAGSESMIGSKKGRVRQTSRNELCWVGPNTNTWEAFNFGGDEGDG
jgi:hypothetical protein